jgi:hypothetical protein
MSADAPASEQEPRQGPPSGGSVVVRAALVVAGMLGMGYFASMLIESGKATGAAVRAYVADARAGKPRTPLRRSDDAEATTKLLAGSTDLSIRNFTVSSGGGTAHACVWTSVHLAGGRTASVDFFLEKQGEAWAVASLSTTRACTCPDGTDPCSMP